MLPIVSCDIAPSVEHSIPRGGTDDEYIMCEMARLNEQNPVIARFISAFATAENRDLDYIRGVTTCGIFVYKLLESQAESDKMKEEIRL